MMFCTATSGSSPTPASVIPLGSVRQSWFSEGMYDASSRRNGSSPPDLTELCDTPSTANLLLSGVCSTELTITHTVVFFTHLDDAYRPLLTGAALGIIRTGTRLVQRDTEPLLRSRLCLRENKTCSGRGQSSFIPTLKVGNSSQGCNSIQLPWACKRCWWTQQELQAKRAGRFYLSELFQCGACHGQCCDGTRHASEMC